MITLRKTGIIQIDGDESRKCLRKMADGAICLLPLPGSPVHFPETIIPVQNIFDIMTPTMCSLLEDLAKSSPLFQAAQTEWGTVRSIIDDPQSFEHLGYGVWTFYPEKKHLVRFATEHWHKTALTVRNSSLLAPAGKPHAWQEGRDLLSNTVLAVAGASVGSNIFHASAMTMRPKAIKTADAKQYQVNNANRVRLNYAELGRNKSLVVAEQLQAVDPFTEVYVYDSGINAESIEMFVGGNSGSGEPAAHIVVEETDDPNTKIALREVCRKMRVPVVMVSDIGAAVQIDVRRYDKDPGLSLAYGMEDRDVYEIKKQWDMDMRNREKLLNVFCAISGREVLRMDKIFTEIILQQIPVEFSGLPQLGSTAAMGGGFAAWIISRIALGEKAFERMHFNPLTMTVSSEGKLL